MEIKEKKELASNWFRDLRDTFCSSFELIEGNKYSFERKSWPHRHSGGGEMSIMKGEVFEKVGVNISTVSGKFQEDFRGQIKGTEQSPEYFATGISLVAHMNSPKIPAFHFNTRFLVTGESWFGGGADLTPTLSDKEAVDLFHNHMKDACSDYKKDAYEEYKKNCDEYFQYECLSIESEIYNSNIDLLNKIYFYEIDKVTTKASIDAIEQLCSKKLNYEFEIYCDIIITDLYEFNIDELDKWPNKSASLTIFKIS